MKAISQKGEPKQEMAKMILFSFKALLMLFTTWLVVPLAEMIEQFSNNDHPPIILFWIFSILLLCHELLLVVLPDMRKAVIEHFRVKGKVDIRQVLASWFSLICIRLFGFGKLFEIYYNKGFDDKTYYYLILIILILVGGVAVTPLVKKIIDK